MQVLRQAIHYAAGGSEPADVEVAKVIQATLTRAQSDSLYERLPVNCDKILLMKLVFGAIFVCFRELFHGCLSRPFLDASHDPSAVAVEGSVKCH